MNETQIHRQSNRAFTLIELLVVVAVIALLAAMIFPVTAVVNRNKIQKKARVELDQLDMFIQGYKDKLGFYPPGNPNTNHAMTPLYYELAGTKRSAANTGATYETLDGSSTISASNLKTAFGVDGIMNSMVGEGSDEGAIAQKFLTGSRPVPTDTVQADPPDARGAPRILVTSIGWKREPTPIFPGNPRVSPVFYNPINPTNNPNSYDMWVDVIVGSKTNRISNWTKEPIVLQ